MCFSYCFLDISLYLDFFTLSRQVVHSEAKLVLDIK